MPAHFTVLSKVMQHLLQHERVRIVQASCNATRLTIDATAVAMYLYVQYTRYSTPGTVLWVTVMKYLFIRLMIVLYSVYCTTISTDNMYYCRHRTWPVKENESSENIKDLQYRELQESIGALLGFCNLLLRQTLRGRIIRCLGQTPQLLGHRRTRVTDHSAETAVGCIATQYCRRALLAQ
jgi:hypothetical protein